MDGLNTVAMNGGPIAVEEIELPEFTCCCGGACERKLLWEELKEKYKNKISHIAGMLDFID